MTHAKKAALLSGLLIPGLGQLTLKHYKTGFALIVVVFICMAIVITISVQHAQAIVNQIQAEGGIMDPTRLKQAIEQSRDQQNSGLINLAHVWFNWLLDFWCGACV